MPSPTVDSKLDSVTLHREGAVCKRLALIPAGSERRVLLGGLPLSLEPGSLRARVTRGSVDLAVLDVRPLLEASLREEVDVPREALALEAAETSLEALLLEKSRLDAEVSELEALRPVFPRPKTGEPPRVTSVKALLALADFADARLAQRLSRRREVMEAVEKAQEEVQLRRRRIAESSTAQSAERTRVTRVAALTLSRIPTDGCEVALEYQVTAARWTPSYALLLEPGLTRGTLRMRASVAQGTGEDWVGVTLALSTASLERRMDAPELKSLHIGRAQEAPAPSGFRAPPPGLGELFESLDASLAAARAPSGGGPGGSPFSLGGAASAEMGFEPEAPRLFEESGTEGGADADGADFVSDVSAPASMSFGHASAGGSPPGGPPRASPAPMASMAPPPPAPAMASAPAPRMAMERMAKKKVAAPARNRSMLKEEAPERDEARRGGGGEDDEGAARVTSLPQDFLDYASLTLEGALGGAAETRGVLVHHSRFDLTTTTTTTTTATLQSETLQMLVLAGREGIDRVRRLPLPFGSHAVTDVDSFDYLFSCAERLDVPSTAQWVQVTVMSSALELTPEYVCVPSVEEKVYRTLSLRNASTHAILRGPVDVSLGDKFLLTSRLPPIPPAAKTPHRLGLGVEEAISVVRRTDFKEATAGFLGGGSRSLVHGVEVELRNRLASAAPVRVLERLPQPAPDERDVKLEDITATPSWEEPPRDDAEPASHLPGARQWRVTLTPGQTLKLQGHYTIRIPANRMLVGGNRRD